VIQLCPLWGSLQRARPVDGEAADNHLLPHIARVSFWLPLQTPARPLFFFPPKTKKKKGRGRSSFRPCAGPGGPRLDNLEAAIRSAVSPGVRRLPPKQRVLYKLGTTGFIVERCTVVRGGPGLPRFVGAGRAVAVMAVLYWTTVASGSPWLHRPAGRTAVRGNPSGAAKAHPGAEGPAWPARADRSNGWGVHRHHHKFSDQAQRSPRRRPRAVVEHSGLDAARHPADFAEVERFTGTCSATPSKRWLGPLDFLMLQLPLGAAPLVVWRAGRCSRWRPRGLGALLGDSITPGCVYSRSTWLSNSATHAFYRQLRQPRSVHGNCWWVAISSLR